MAHSPTICYGSCLVSDKRHLYLVGGNDFDLNQTVKTVERFDPILATWEKVAAMNEARYDAFGAAMNGKIYIAGGINKNEGHRTVLNSCEVYDPSFNEWQVMSSLKVCRQAAKHGMCSGSPLCGWWLQRRTIVFQENCQWKCLS